MSPAVRAILTNREVIAVDQDMLGIEGHRAVKLDDTEIWVRSLADGSQAVVLLNRSAERRSIRLDWSALHLPSYVTLNVRDLWLRQDRPKATASLAAEVAPHAVTFLQVAIARNSKHKP
jgi:alpha-galactosidase